MVAEPAETVRIEIGVVPPGTSQVSMTRVFITDDDGAALSMSGTGGGSASGDGPPPELPLGLGEWQRVPPPLLVAPPLVWTIQPEGTEPSSQPKEKP